MAVVNVQKYNKAEKPVFEEAKEVNNDLGMAVSAIGRGIQQYGHLRQIENHEDKTQAIKDFTEFQGETNAKIDELSSTSGENFIKDANDYYNKAKNKRLKDKSSAYRTAFEELSSNNYRKISPEIIKKNTQNSLIRMADNVELAAKNLINNSNDTGTMYQINDILNNQIDGMDLPDWKRTQFKHQITREITSSVAEKMIQQDPVSARKFIENDKRFQNLFNEQEIQGFYKVADDQLFNNFVDSNVEQTISILNDKEKAKKIFKSFEDSDIEKYKTKAKKILRNNLEVQKQQQEIRKNNIFTSFYSNPTAANLEKVKTLVPNITKKEIENLETRRDFVASKNAKTIDEELIPKINDFLDILKTTEIKSDTDFIELSQKVGGFQESLMRLNSVNNALSAEDYENYNTKLNDLQNKLSQGYAKEIVDFIKDEEPNWIPIYHEGKKLLYSRSRGFLTKEEREEARKNRVNNISFRKDEKIRKAVKDSYNDMLSAVFKGDYEEAKYILKKAKRDIVNIKYPELKDIEDGSLIVKNGIVYKFVGINGTDAIMETK